MVGEGEHVGADLLLLGHARSDVVDEPVPPADPARPTKDGKRRGQNSLFGMSAAAPATTAMKAAVKPEWPEEEKLKNEKETLGFYITGHPLNKYTDVIREVTKGRAATTETLHLRIDEAVDIGGIVSQLKRTKIKK